MSTSEICFSCGKPAHRGSAYRVPLNKVVDVSETGAFSKTVTTRYKTAAVDVPSCAECSQTRKTLKTRVRWAKVAYLALALAIVLIALLIHPYLGTPVAVLAIVGAYGIRPYLVHKHHAQRLQAEADPRVTALIAEGWKLGDAPGEWWNSV